MKKMTRILALLLALLMLLAAFPATSLAASKVVTLKKGHWYTLRDEHDSAVYYKLTLSADSIVTFQWKGSTDYVGLDFCTNRSGSGSFYHQSMFSGKGSCSTALVKGVYYLNMVTVGPEDEPRAKGMVTVKKAVNKSNFSLGGAVSLKAGKKLEIAQTPRNCYDRWYKIKLTRRQTVTVRTNAGYGRSVALFDGKMHQLACKYTGSKAVSKNSLKAGTYYIRIKAPKDFDLEGTGIDSEGHLGRYISVTWS